jgi:phosphoribosylformylglycinamidine synthase
MTEFRLAAPLESFASGAKPEPTRSIPLLAEGEAALRRANAELGLALDEADIA